MTKNGSANRDGAPDGGAGASRMRSLLIGPYPSRRSPAQRTSGRHAQNGSVEQRPSAARLAEARSLAAALSLDVVDAVLVSLNDIRPATYIGAGKVDELAARIKAEAIGLVIMDCALSPVQQRNLERALGAKVIDRTALILEIFGERAHTREGTLQVEHAHLTHQKSRLVRSWTHLERQRGGFGFLGGRGETQIEAERRQIEERIA